MIYQVAEKFKSIQGEGVYAGTPMAFIRFVGCSVGKRVCVACDTDFEQPISWRGGGEFTADQLDAWVHPYTHVCLTGGEPLDQNLEDIAHTCYTLNRMIHLETSGTKWLSELMTRPVFRKKTWVCVSPKPGFHEEMVMAADEVKVIMPGLGVLKEGVCQPAIRDHVGEALIGSYQWPTLQDALRWADAGKVVFLQPRNGKLDVDQNNLRLCQDIVAQYPQLRLSVQLHKVLKVQ